MRKILFIIPFFLWTCGDSTYSNTTDMFVEHINSVIEEPNNKISSEDILWWRYSDSFYLSDSTNEIYNDLYFVQLKDFKRKEMDTDRFENDKEGLKRYLKNYSPEYEFGYGYYLLYTNADSTMNDKDIEGNNYNKRFKTFTHIYKLEQNFFNEEYEPSLQVESLYGFRPFDFDLSGQFGTTSAFLHDLFKELQVGDSSNFQEYMSEWSNIVNDDLKGIIQLKALEFKRDINIFFAFDTGSGSCTDITNGDWVYPDLDNTTAAFKFNSDNTFNYSSTYFLTTRYGTWESFGDCSYEIKYQNGDKKVLYISGDTFNIGNTEYRKY